VPVVPVLVVPVPVDVDAGAPDVPPDVPPEVEEAPPPPPAPPVPEEEAVTEPDVLDGVVDPDPAAALPLLVAVAAEPVVVVPAPVTGGILMGTLADEHTDVTAFDTED
jgi:hypothetical protein